MSSSTIQHLYVLSLWRYSKTAVVIYRLDRIENEGAGPLKTAIKVATFSDDFGHGDEWKYKTVISAGDHLHHPPAVPAMPHVKPAVLPFNFDADTNHLAEQLNLGKL